MRRELPALLLAAMSMALVPTARGAAPTTPASAATALPGVVTARYDVAISRPAVRLSDLFDGLPPSQDREIGPAPTPGRSISVPEPQMAAIAAQFGVDWQPDPGFSGLTIRRSGRPVSQSEVLAALTPALAAATGRVDGRITLLPFSSPTLPGEFTGPPQVLQLDVGRGDGRFSATLGFGAPDADPVSLRVNGRVEETVDGLVLTRALPAGSVLTPADLAAARLDRGRSADPPLTDPTGAVGFPLARSVPAGTPVTAALLSHPPAVTKSRPVVLRLEQDGLTLTTPGIALEAGTLGAFIHVLNTTSRAVLLGQVVDGTVIRVEPGTVPVSGAGGDPSRNLNAGRMS